MIPKKLFLVSVTKKLDHLKALLTFFHAISIPRPKANVMPTKWTLLFPVQHDGQF